MKLTVPIYPWPVPPIVQEQIDKLGNYNLVEAVPGGPGPVLAIRKPPPFACDAVVVLKPENVADGLHVVTGEGIAMVTVRDFIGKIFKAEAPLMESITRNEKAVSFK